ncbi:Signal peptidase I [Carbonactinospora thermoautotrophica]|uniref:Signal peptidase I n=1 Tax=Carbonactinospora thermoautotrophica TaxID=1469144 RepID=A0A132MP83_9ACTN|nr:signal peptidase I [Carbonactinospora thermoautotrophica]KWW99670.1 Signal peptidase I [Carbonactinospora thermoautotrophica]
MVEQAAAADNLEAGAAKKAKNRTQRSFWYELPILVAIALLLAFVIKTFLVQAFTIPSGSMENTLQVGDRVLVNKLGSWLGEDVERGEVIVFKDPGGWVTTPLVRPANPVTRGVQDVLMFVGLMPAADQKYLIKRVIGLPGDRIRCCDDQGRVTVNGAPLDEPYVFPGNPAAVVRFDVVVPEGRLWVMGDHRAVSFDSSKHMADPGGGTIPLENVVGRAFVKIWRPENAGWLPVPSTFEQPALNKDG